MVMGDRPDVETSSPPEAALDLFGLAGQLGVALGRVPLKTPWRGPFKTLSANVTANLTREMIRSFMGYSTSLRIEDFRSIEMVLDRLSSVVMPPVIASYNVSYEVASVGGVPGIWYRPDGVDEPRRTIAYFHGGGYVGTSPWMYAAFTSAIARRTRCDVFVADYRLAPEFPYPHGAEDGMTVLGALVDSGIPASDIFLAGDSGGGGLICSLMHLMDYVEAQDLAGVILFSPEVDLVLDQPSVADNASHDILPWNIPTSAYLRGDGHHAFVSPLIQDVSDWPPTYIVYGADEMFRDPIRQFVDHLEASDVEVEAVEVPGMFHVFPILMPWAPPSHKTFRDLQRFIKAA